MDTNQTLRRIQILYTPRCQSIQGQLHTFLCMLKINYHFNTDKKNPTSSKSHPTIAKSFLETNKGNNL